MLPERLAMMANQIGRAFGHLPDAKAVEQTAHHMKLYWEPRMRRAILAHLDECGAENSGLDPRVRLAIEALRAFTPTVAAPDASNRVS